MIDLTSILIGAGAGAAVSLLVSALRGPRVVYMPVYSGGSPMRVRVERPVRRRPEDYDPRAFLPKDIDIRPKLGSMAEAYEAEKRQLLQAQRKTPGTDPTDG